VASARINASQNHCLVWSAPAGLQGGLGFQEFDWFPDHSMSEREMGFGSGCLTVIGPSRSAVPLRGAIQSERGQVDTPDQTPSSIKADARDMIFAVLVVSQLEEASMLIDPLRQTFPFVEGQEWKGHFLNSPPPSSSTFPACLPLQLTPLCRHSFDSSTNQPHSFGSSHISSARSNRQHHSSLLARNNPRLPSLPGKAPPERCNWVPHKQQHKDTRYASDHP
jgi:hypothetical protein